MKNTTVIKDSNNQIIALKLRRFRVDATYYVGYGANLRKLRGVAKKSAVVLATTKDRAIEIAARVHDIKESGSLSAGYIVRATRLKTILSKN